MKKSLLKSGFSLIELIIGITLYTITMTTIIFVISSMIRMEIHLKGRIYNAIDKIDKISKEYFIKKD